MNGKVLRGNFDHFNDCKTIQILSAFATDSLLVLGHIWITDEDRGKKVY